MVSLLSAPSSHAAEQMYWDNYSGSPETVGFAATDGLGGGALNLGAQSIGSPEGMAYDTVTNRLFVANEGGSEGASQITAVNLDGSGAGPFVAPGAPVDKPEGIVLDPVSRRIYWANSSAKTISWALLDGSAGGVLATPAPVDTYRIALDPGAGRIYWYDGTAKTIRFANVDGSGGGDLNIAGASPSNSATGIAVDPAGGRVFWVNSDAETISFASLAGTGGGDLNVAAAGASFNSPYGLAFDPSLQRLYWANFDNGTERLGAIGLLDLTGGGGRIDIPTAAVNGPQDLQIIKSPTAVAAPVLARGSGSARANLTCPTGTWGADYPGSFVYQAPRAYAYQWAFSGAPIAGAVGATLTATEPGSYTCTVTATNHVGAAASSSAALNVIAAKLKLIVKTKKAGARPGKLATIKVQAFNQGDLKSKRSRLCVKLTKKQKAYLVQPKCKKLGEVSSQARTAAKLKIRLKPDATGSYRVKLVVKGAAGKAVKARLKVVG